MKKIYKLGFLSLILSSVLLADSTTLGTGATATGVDSTAIGFNATADGIFATAIGENSTASSGASTALGSDATATGASATAIGDDTTAIGTQSTAIGGQSNANGHYSTAIGAGSIANGTESIASGMFSQANGVDSIAIGSNSDATADGSIAIGGNGGNNQFTDGASATGVNSVAIGTQSTATADNSVAIGANSEADEVNTVSVGSYGNERRITDVATPTNDTDATNKKYVDDEISLSASNTLSSAYSYTDSLFSSISMSGGISESVVDAKDQAILNSAKSYTDEKFDSLDKKIDTLEQTLTKELRVGVASAIALGVTPVFQNDKDNALGIGFGNYEGESAMAINYARKIASNQVLQLGTSLNAAHRAFKVGYSVSW
jgi:autotransporter adhesin